jgi:nitroreductase
VSDHAEAMLGTMRRLRAVRDFADSPVDDAALHEIMRVARWSGSAENRQPWRFVVVRDRDLRERLAALTPEAPQVGRAPVVIGVVMPGERAVLDAFDEARAAERILLAAAALDLGAALAWVPQDARAAAASLLGVPEGRLLRTVIAIGHPAPAATTPKRASGPARLPLETLVHDGGWREDETDG